jgi:predicted transcriptional regulator
MNRRQLVIRFQSIDDFASESKKQLAEVEKSKGKKSFIQPKNLTLWDSVESYQRFMSDQKYAILATIYNHKPKSVYQLAKLLDRAQPNVSRDCDALAGHGFIVLEESGGARGGLIPKLSFDYNAIIVELPSVKYKVVFDDEDAAKIKLPMISTGPSGEGNKAGGSARTKALVLDKILTGVRAVPN